MDHSSSCFWPVKYTSFVEVSHFTIATFLPWFWGSSSLWLLSQNFSNKGGSKVWHLIAQLWKVTEQQLLSSPFRLRRTFCNLTFGGRLGAEVYIMASPWTWLLFFTKKMVEILQIFEIHVRNDFLEWKETCLKLSLAKVYYDLCVKLLVFYGFSWEDAHPTWCSTHIIGMVWLEQNLEDALP